MAKKTKKNLPAKRGNTLPSNIDDQMLVDAQESTGFENMGADDIAIPFIMILQALSPQVRGAARIKGASEGDFFNTVTNEVLKDTLYLIPCAYEKAYVEWVPRNKGGGFVHKYNDSRILEQTERDENNGDMLPNGNQVVTTAYHYCLLVKEDNTTEQVVISLTSTQLKKSRRWNSSMIALKMKHKGRILTPPMYSHIYEASSVEESNDLGAWSGWVFGNPEKITDADLYMMAKKFHDDVTKGTVKTAPPPDMSEHMGSPEDDIEKTGEDVF
jgi:hypothetical protein